MIVYTDGATSNNGKANAIGGWAWVKVKDDKVFEWDNRQVLNATNNICELLAIINACKSLSENEQHTIYSDSAYIINCYKQQWYKKWEINGWKNSKKEPVANKELWIELIPFFKNENFNFEKVKGHANNFFNEYADKLAVEAKNF